MIIQHNPPLHLTYCLNIHPGESWADQLAAIEGKTQLVAKYVADEEWFGVGLRLSAQAAEELMRDPSLRGAALDVFAEHRLYPFSVNAFPFGRFHAGPVKENVYAPDWRTTERRDYTFGVADILAEWLPEGVDGSISTVPGSYKSWVSSPESTAKMALNLGAVAAYLAALRDDTGREIHLGLEPEPDCFLETTDEAVAFFKQSLWTDGVAEVKRIRKCYTSEAEEIMRRHIGVCFDTCHVALQFEDPAVALRRFVAEGIRISKVQLSAALSVQHTPEAIVALKSFAEPVYLHQTKARTRDGVIHSWPDLPLALDEVGVHPDIEEIRVHFHVPLFFEGTGIVESTAGTLAPAFFAELRKGATSHVEIETYTFDVLPPEVHPGDMVKSIAREFQWVREHI
jgi:hypothetical protein